MKLNQLRDIVAVAERGSLRAAARHLELAQPALTRSVRDLERELEAMDAARYRSLAERVAALVETSIQYAPLGVLGEPRVNVLKLNLALDDLTKP